MGERVHSAQELPLNTRDLIEHVAERMDAAVGRWRLEFVLEDGTLTRFFRHEGPGPAGALGRFDRAENG
ncbi:MAG: hypothetical protein WBB76_04860 [Gaiellaceae bacterium]